MPEDGNQPKDTDVVLGGNAPPPLTSAVLGGLAGVKHRLKSGVVEHRIAALTEALNYGDAGLNLVIQALDDTAEQVRDFAYLAFATQSEQLTLLEKGVAAWNKWRSEGLRLRGYDANLSDWKDTWRRKSSFSWCYSLDLNHWNMWRWSSVFDDVNLNRVNLTLANLRRINFRECNLTEANLSKADLSEAKLYNANLSKANLSETNLSKANLSRAILEGVYLQKANLNGANFSKTDLRKFNFSEAILQRVNFSKADLRQANFSKATLCKSKFINANLSEADLTEADLRGVSLRGADLHKANLYGANLIGAIMPDGRIYRERSHRILVKNSRAHFIS